MDLAASEAKDRPAKPLEIALALDIASAVLNRRMGLVPIQFHDELVVANEEVRPVATDHLLGFYLQICSTASFGEKSLNGGRRHCHSLLSICRGDRYRMSNKTKASRIL